MNNEQHCPICGRLAKVIGKIRLNLAFEATQLHCPEDGYVESGYRFYALTDGRTE